MVRRLSPSRLNDFLGCAHHAALWLAGEKAPESDDAGLELVRAKGMEHEREALARLEGEHGPAARIPGEGRIEDRVAATRDAVADGARLIYQAAYTNDRWVGLPDFVVVHPNSEGELAFAPEDAKLSRHAKPEHLLQLGVYVALMREAGLPVSATGAIHLGGGATASFDLNRTSAITARLMRRFEAFADADIRETRAVRSSACSQCPFQSRCEAEWRAADSPIFTAGIRSSQMLRLEASGVTTLAAMAELDPAKPVDGIGGEAFSRLIQQARLQVRAREEGEAIVEPIVSEPGKGFALLPPPAAGDVYFDMEGDPHYPGGLEYLFGLWGPLGAEDQATFVPIWAHSREEEKVAFERLIDRLTDHLSRFPQAHVYHYAAYETVALKRLAMQHATRELELDALLRSQRFVDLYQIVRQAVRASTEGYSLKNLEKIYWGKRSGEVTNAGDSIVMYERWRETADQTVLDDISAYNKDDVVSTAELHSWLEGLRALAPRALPKAVVVGASGEDSEDRDASLAQRAEAIAALQLLASNVRNSGRATPETLDLIAELLWFHERAQKPQWWALFDRQNWSAEELVEDIESIGNAWLDPSTPVYSETRSLVATYRFEPQETKLDEGDAVRIAETLTFGGTIGDFYGASGEMTVRRASKFGPFPERAGFIAHSLIDQGRLKAGVQGFAERLIGDGWLDASGEWETKPEALDQAMMNILERRPPRLRGLTPGMPLIAPNADLVAATVDLVRRLEDSHLVIQGPPGTGKTYTTSHAILALMQDGQRIAVSSNSHKAINNLLAAIDERAEEAGFAFTGFKKASGKSGDSVHSSDNICSVTKRGQITSDALLVGATAFHFAEESKLAFDYLFVDEAGQVSLANLVAMAGCARNIVLVGDQMQLPQPVQGTHPGESGLSCLDYLMCDHATVPPELGVLLNMSWRMHPSVCRYVSDSFYDGRLTAHPRTATRSILLTTDADPALKPHGVVIETVLHEGRVQNNPEEAERIAVLVQSLLKQHWRDDKGDEHPITLSEIVVVAPYNAQVNRLRRTLPARARVGTVDKFQGQEAVVAIVSMATSNGEDAPRGTDFLFNPNRLNVAISRAKCLAILVRGNDLLEFAPGSVKDLTNLEGFARLETHIA